MPFSVRQVFLSCVVFVKVCGLFLVCVVCVPPPPPKFSLVIVTDRFNVRESFN